MCVRELVKRGWLKSAGQRGLYRFCQLQDHEHGQSAQLQEKIWRAIRISGSYTIFEIAQLSGATIDYVKKYTSFLIRNGLVRKTGKKGQRAIYRPILDLPSVMPRMRSKRNKKEVERQDLIDLGWQMMRMIRDGDMLEAFRMCGEMHNRLFDINQCNHCDPILERTDRVGGNQRQRGCLDPKNCS